ASALYWLSGYLRIFVKSWIAPPRLLRLSAALPSSIQAAIALRSDSETVPNDRVMVAVAALAPGPRASPDTTYGVRGNNGLHVGDGFVPAMATTMLVASGSGATW